MIKALATVVAASLLVSGPIFAGQRPMDSHSTTFQQADVLECSKAPDLFRKGEVFVEAGAAILDGHEQDNQIGVTGGVGYFFLREVGVRAQASWYDDAAEPGANLAAHLILRLPLDEVALAPFIYGGVGYETSGSTDANYQVGAGLEVRLLEHLSMTIDAKYQKNGNLEADPVYTAMFRFVF